MEDEVKLHGINSQICYDADVCKASVSSLSCISAAKLVSNSSILTKLNCLPLPQQIMSLLMNVAISHSRILCIKLLMDHWQQENLVLELPNDLQTWKVFLLHSSPLYSSVVNGFYTSVTGIVRHVLDWVKNDSTTTLCHIDFGECPLPDLLVNEISMAAMSLQKSITLEMRLSSQTRTEPKFILIINCALLRRETVRHLLFALQCISSSKHNRLKLIITGLHVTPDVFGSVIFEVLSMTNHETMLVLSYEKCYIDSNEDIISRLFHSISTFHFLEGLDLSYIGLHARRDLGGILQLNLHLQKLTHLKRLDVSHSILTKSVSLLLEGLYLEKNCKDCCSGENASRAKLQYLNFEGCMLDDIDINFLVQSQHAHSLLYLNLNYCVLATQGIVSLIKACSNLRVLEMARCKFSCDASSHIVEALKNSQHLKYLNISGANIADDIKMCIGPHKENLPQLQCLATDNVPIHV